MSHSKKVRKAYAILIREQAHRKGLKLSKSAIIELRRYINISGYKLSWSKIIVKR